MASAQTRRHDVSDRSRADLGVFEPLLADPVQTSAALCDIRERRPARMLWLGATRRRDRCHSRAGRFALGAFVGMGGKGRVEWSGSVGTRVVVGASLPWLLFRH